MKDSCCLFLLLLSTIWIVVVVAVILIMKCDARIKKNTSSMLTKPQWLTYTHTQTNKRPHARAHILYAKELFAVLLHVISHTSIQIAVVSPWNFNLANRFPATGFVFVKLLFVCLLIFVKVFFFCFYYMFSGYNCCCWVFYLHLKFDFYSICFNLVRFDLSSSIIFHAFIFLCYVEEERNNNGYSRVASKFNHLDGKLHVIFGAYWQIERRRSS